MTDSQKPLSVYSASAGSGKTFTIAYEYISMMLLASENQNKTYRNILAVTFTNKACDEMKSRIILNLFLISNRDKFQGKQKESIQDIINRIKERTGLGENEIIRRSRCFFSLILHDYSFFSIFTIDSFFQKIVRNLTFELGMQQNYELELDTNLVISELVDDLMLESENDENLRHCVDALIEKNIDSDRKWSPKEKIRNFVLQAILSEYKIGNTFTDEYIHNLDEKISSFCNGVKRCMDNIGAEIKRNGLESEDFTQGYANLYYYKMFVTDAPESVKYKELLLGKYKNDKFKENKWFSSKSKHLDKADAFNAIVGELKALDFEDFCTAYVIRKNIELVGLLDRAIEILHSNLERDSIFLLSDVPSMLSQIIKGAEGDDGAISVMPFVFEKVGTTYNNFLIDEFQDTSQKQWSIFYTMLSEALSQNNRSIIVGDIKQSIYSWRGGDWKILSDLTNKKILSDFIKPENLDKNYRTARNIVEFNNDFFESVFPSENKNPEKNVNVFGRPNSSLYKDVEQKVKHDESSEVNVRFYSSDILDTDGIRENIFKDLVSKVESLQLEHNVQPSQIMILTRKKREASYIANSFYAIPPECRKPGVRYDVVSNEALYIISNRAVRLIVAYMRYLLNNTDELSLIEAAYLYYQEKNHLSIVNQFDKATLLDNLKNAIGAEMAVLSDKQAFEIVDIVINRLGLNKSECNVPFLVAFRNVVHDFSVKSTDLQAFMEYWDERGSEETLKIPESQNAIKIITIHASKGLEADYIFIPFCSWKFVDKIPGAVEYMFVNNPYSDDGSKIPVENKAELQNTMFKNEYADDIFKKRIEAFNLLYVAFTRAKYGLYIYAKEEVKAFEEPTSVSQLLADYFNSVSNVWEPEVTERNNYTVKEFTRGELDLANENASRTDGNDNFITEYPVNEATEFNIKHHLNEDTEGEISARERGERYHSIFENIIVAEDVEMAVNSIRAKGEVDMEAAEAMKQEIKAKIASPVVSRWFAGNAEVFNEFNIIVPSLDGGSFKRPDRVMIFDDEIVIVDYKFGEEKNEKRYSEQVRRYASLISEIDGFGSKKVSMYIWYYMRNEVVKVGMTCNDEIIKFEP